MSLLVQKHDINGRTVLAEMVRIGDNVQTLLPMLRSCDLVTESSQHLCHQPASQSDHQRLSLRGPVSETH